MTQTAQDLIKRAIAAVMELRREPIKNPEAAANIVLAYRHLEDAVARLAAAEKLLEAA